MRTMVVVVGKGAVACMTLSRAATTYEGVHVGTGQTRI